MAFGRGLTANESFRVGFSKKTGQPGKVGRGSDEPHFEGKLYRKNEPSCRSLIRLSGLCGGGRHH